MTNDKLNIWLIDDHLLFRAGFKTLLSRLENTVVTFEASNGADFIAQLNIDKPDIVFLDISMPKVDGVEATQKALSLSPDLNIIILSMFGERDYYTKLAELGVKGFLLKSCAFYEVEQAIASVSEGDYFFSQELLQLTSSATNRNNQHDDLSEREKEILVKICDGASNQEIAEQLFISKRTVEKHRANIMLKTSCNNTASLVIFAIKNGFYNV